MLHEQCTADSATYFLLIVLSSLFPDNITTPLNIFTMNNTSTHMWGYIEIEEQGQCHLLHVVQCVCVCVCVNIYSVGAHVFHYLQTVALPPDQRLCYMY